jgi:peptidoglycan/LPS O-acetylase OafA/YrhL
MMPASAPEPPRYGYIDALRGIAITAVMASHLVNFFPDMSWHVFIVTQFGGHGVQLFFLVSALTLTMSWRVRHDGAVHFWVRRLFRIAPMFWLALVVYGGMNAAGVWPTGGSDLRSLMLTFTFLHGWSISAINLVVPGGWTIGVEMSFYAIFPFVVTRVTSLWRAVALVAVT